MRLGRFVMIVLVFAAAVFCAGQAASTRSAGAPASNQGTAVSAADRLVAEQTAQAEKLIAELSADEWKTRDQAHSKLREMGPAIFSVLLAHRNDADKETASRIDALIKEYIWLTRGAVIVRIVPGSKAEKLGMKLGDVVVKIKDIEIARSGDIDKANMNESRIITLTRDARIVTIDAPAGKLGFDTQDWQLLKGGQAYIRALRALSQKDYALAVKMFAQARAEGSEVEPHKNLVAGCLEYQLDHKKAMEIYREFKGDTPGCSDSHEEDLDHYVHGLPINNLHSAFLLELQKDSDGEDTHLLHQLEIWFTGPGRNLPLARTILEKEWSAAAMENAQPSYVDTHMQARQRLAMMDRRWKDVIQIAKDHLTFRTAEIAMEAAVQAQDVEEAARLANFLIADGLNNKVYRSHTSVMLAMAAAVMADRQDLFDSMLNELSKANSEQLTDFFAGKYRYAMDTIALNEKFLPGLMKLAENVKSDELKWLILRRIASQPNLTPEQWNEAMAKYARNPKYPDIFTNVDAMANLRLGNYAPVRQAFESWKSNTPDNPSVKAMELLERKKSLLAGAWAPLVGTIAVFGDPKSGNGLWAVRYDGQVFSIDENDNIRHYEGIDQAEPFYMLESGVVIPYSSGAVLVRSNQVYLLDSQAGRWIPTYAASGVQDIEWGMWDNGTTAPTLRFVMQNYPVNGPGRELMFSGWCDKWRWNIFSGDIGIVTKRGQNVSRDLSKEIAALAGKKTPAAVYRPASAGQTLVIPTNYGLWLMDAEGTITRAELGLKDPDVMTVAMPWPVVEGKCYIGVVPQQGGQVFEMDIASGRFRRTDGFCGLGPQDAYSAWNSKAGHLSPMYALMNMYHKSHPGAASRPASQPAAE